MKRKSRFSQKPCGKCGTLISSIQTRQHCLRCIEIINSEKYKKKVQKHKIIRYKGDYDNNISNEDFEQEKLKQELIKKRKSKLLDIYNLAKKMNLIK